MDYKKHYDMLIERGKNRVLHGYKEKHHIIPRCIGGNNEKDNLVYLTAEEHYIAHQLLTKIYKDKPCLIYAAFMMGVSSKNQKRNNKIYGWLKRKYATQCSINSIGEGNSQYNTRWISNINTKQNKKINIEDVELYISKGWVEGRNVWNRINTCKKCGKIFEAKSKKTKYCSTECRKPVVKTFNIIDENYDDMKKMYIETGSVSKVLKNYNFRNNVGHKYLSSKLKNDGVFIVKQRDA